MANIKISELNALTPPAAADELPVVDVSATSTKKTTVGEVVGIINGDVEVATDGTATISELPVSKLQDGEARQLLQTAANGTDVEWTDDVDLPGTLGVTGATTLDDALNVAGLASLDGGIDVDGVFTVADTTGNVATSGTLGVTGQSTLASAAISDLTENRVVIAGASGELEDSANLTFDGSELGVTGTLDVSSNGTIGGDLTVVGDLTVEGATTILETQTVTVEDKNIELGVVDTPSDATADGGGITLKGATDKTINWIDATDAWTSSEHIELASGKEFYIDGNGVLNATTLGSGVVNSSLTSVGTIGTGTWQGTTIATAYGGTGQTTYANGELLIGNTTGNTLSKATLTAGTGISVTNGSGSIAVAIDSSVVTTSNTGTVTSTMILDGTIVNGDINASAAIADTKLDTISTAGKVSNSATTATDANTANAIVARDASGDFTAGTITADLTGNADTATALETARDIGGVSFDGTANINLPGVNTTGNQDTSGNAATATKLDSSRTFEVTGDVTGTVSSDLTSGASIATSIASGVIVDADVNAAAAIAGTKIDPDFGSQTVETTGDLAINTNVLFVDSSESAVGIRTTTPTTALDVNGQGRFTNDLLIADSTATRGRVYADSNGLNLRSESGLATRFLQVGTELARFDGSGRLLVGTSSSIGGSTLQVAGTGGNPLEVSRFQAGNAGPFISTYKSRGATVGTNTAVVADDLLGAIQFHGAEGSGYQAAANIRAFVESGTISSTSMPGRLVFSVTADGSASPTEALRISNDRSITVSDGGDVVLGTTTGTKIGTATSQKIGFYNATPVVQPTTGVAEAAFVENSGGTAVNVDSTFGGYTIQQVVEALQTLGLLA